jgi:hypothetical protein
MVSVTQPRDIAADDLDARGAVLEGDRVRAAGAVGVAEPLALVRVEVDALMKMMQLLSWTRSMEQSVMSSMYA